MLKRIGKHKKTCIRKVKGEEHSSREGSKGSKQEASGKTVKSVRKN